MPSHKACKLFGISLTAAQIKTAALGTEKRKIPARMRFLGMMSHLRRGWRTKRKAKRKPGKRSLFETVNAP